ncbi:DUF5712 family protein [Mucilaginibacter sp.]|uniref:DUF5712 family protein n=1 Tax=Mucilaginibacter sp. TaxID=1882438 RepID=UPI003264B104
MHINITKSEAGNNKGSSSQLVTYLEKENKVAEKINKEKQPEYWFNQERANIQPYEVRQGIDNNIAKLSKDDAKFFLVNISPSSKELLFLKEKFGKAGAKEQLKNYANKVMDAYAKNFKRNGITSNQALVYFAKLENNRYYTYKDLEVRKGVAKKGDTKPGDQMHVQVIVSRKDASNSIKLSPLNNSKGSNAAHSHKVGQFDRVAFKQATESIFDSLFNYDREIKESFQYANAMKNGSYEQKKEVKELQRIEQVFKSGNQQSYHGKDIFDVLLGTDQGVNITADPNPFKRKKKKKQGYYQGVRI